MVKAEVAKYFYVLKLSHVVGLKQIQLGDVFIIRKARKKVEAHSGYKPIEKPPKKNKGIHVNISTNVICHVS